MLIPGVPAPKTPDPKKPSFGAPSLGAQTPPFTPRSSNGAHQSPQQSRARRGRASVERFVGDGTAELVRF